MNMLQTFIKATKASYYLARNPSYRMYEHIMIDNRVVYVDDMVILGKLGVPSDCPGIAVMDNMHIVCNKEFLKFPEELQKAAILHEIGHITLRHFKVLFPEGSNKTLQTLKYQYSAITGRGIGFECELEADRFSVNSGADMLALLRAFQKYPSFNTRALRKRIKVLEGYSYG